MKHAKEGTLKPELYAHSRTAHDGITYISGTTTFADKQQYCRAMLFDTGCDFNIASSWYLRDMLGEKWKDMIKPLPGHTVTARMATGHASKAIGTIVLEVTLATAFSDGEGGEPLMEVSQITDGSRHYSDVGWTTTTKAIEYLVFEGIDLPIINGGPWMPHVVSDISCHDQAPTHARIYDTPYMPGKKRPVSNQHVMMRRRRTAPLSQLLVCCAQKDTWVSTLHPQAIPVDIPGCGRVADVGVVQGDEIIDEEPNLDAALDRVPLRYLMDTVQQYGQLHDPDSRFVTHPDSRYRSPTEVNNQLQSGKFEVVVQGIPAISSEFTYGASPFYSREQDIVNITVPADIKDQKEGVYIPAGTVLAIMEFEVDESKTSNPDSQQTGACSHIMDERFMPVELNRIDGSMYTIVEDCVNEMKVSDEATVAAINEVHTREHMLKYTQPHMVVKEFRRYVTELSIEPESTSDQMQAQASNDLDELLSHVTGIHDKLSTWAVHAIDGLVTDTVLQTTRIHSERLIDRCRLVEAYRLFAKDKTPINIGGKGYAEPSNAAIKYRQIIADNAAKQLHNELKATLLRTNYMEQIKRILRETGAMSRIRKVNHNVAGHIQQLIGSEEHYAQCDDITESIAAQMQGLLAEALPPRKLKTGSHTGTSVKMHKEQPVTQHDRFICSVRSAHDEIVQESPNYVYVDETSGISRIHYIASAEVNTEVDQEGFQVNHMAESTPNEDPRLVASITEISSAMDSLEESGVDTGERVCHISDYTRGRCCRVAPTYRNNSKGHRQTPEEQEATNIAGKQREDIMEFITRDSEYQNPLESVLESTFQISPTLVAADHEYHNWSNEDKMVSCEDVLDILADEYRSRIIDVCRHNAPEGSSEQAITDRAKRLAGYLASTELHSFTAKQQSDLVSLIIDGEAAFNCDPNIPPTWRGDDWDELKLKDGAGPITHRERPIPPLALPIILKQIKAWLEAGIVVPSKSPHNSPLMAVVKKPLPPRRDQTTGKVIEGPPAPLRWRVVVDYSLLNRSLQPVNMAGAPRLDTVVHQVGSCNNTAFKLRSEDPSGIKNTWYCSTTDLMAGFHQSTIAPECRDLTAFIVPGVLGENSKLHFVKAPFGTRSMPTYFSRMVGSVLSNLHFGHLAMDTQLDDTEAFQKSKIVRDEQLAHKQASPLLRGEWANTDPGKCVVHYIDDCWAVTMSTWDDHVTALRHLFHKLALYGLGARADKSEFGQVKLGVLGWQVSEGKVHADMGKVHKMIDSLGGPECVLKSRSEVMTALGSVNFYRTLIRNSGGLANILYSLTKKDAFKSPKDWTPFHTAALRALKTALLSDSFLAIPDEKRSFFLMTDSSSHSVGAVVAQLQPDGSERPVSYASSSLPTPARRWGSSERELFAIIHFLDVVFRHLLIFAERVHLVTDHKALEQMVRASRSNNSKLARWIGRLSMWRNAVVTFRAGVLVGPADMLSRLSECRSAAEMAALIPDSHKPISVDKGATAHLEPGESGPTDSVRALGLPMQRLAMLRPPTDQKFCLAHQNFESSAEVNKDPGLCHEDPLKHARAKPKHDFNGLKEWFLSGKATPESVESLIPDDVLRVASVMKPDVNDIPTATGSTEWHQPRGMDHTKYTLLMNAFAMKHPLKDQDLKHEEIFLTKVLDTRPIDVDYQDYYSGDAEAKLRGDGQLREMIVGWTEYESIPLMEILRHGGHDIDADYEEIVYAASISDSSRDCIDEVGKFTSVRDRIQTDDDYDSCDDGLVAAVNDHVDEVLERLGVDCGLDADNKTVFAPNMTDAFPSTFKETVVEVERLMFIQEFDDVAKSDSVCNINNSNCPDRTSSVKSTTGAAFSNRFIRRVSRKMSTRKRSASEYHKTITTAEDVERIFHRELNRCGMTTADTSDKAVEFISGITTVIDEFNLLTADEHGPQIKGHTPAVLRSKVKSELELITGKYRCTATRDPAKETNTPDKDKFDALYTPDEMMQWEIISNEVIQIANERIDSVAHLKDKRTTKAEMAKYIASLCNPDIDTVVCQGVAGSGKTFTAMLCAFMALRKGLLEEVLHTRPLVSTGGVGIGFEPGSVGQKLSFWSKPMADAFKRLSLDEELKSKVSAYPFDRIRGVSMRPRTWLLGDEAQNMNYELLKCLINRTEKHSKFVATGDVNQSDIVVKANSRCGLKMILDGIDYKKITEDGVTGEKVEKPNDPDYISMEQLNKTMSVVTLKHSLRNPDGTKVRQWLEELPEQLKTAAKLVKVGQVTVLQEVAVKERVPVFSAFAGVDNLGHAVCKPPKQGCKYVMKVIGGSEIDAQARAAFRRRNGFEPMYENETVTIEMLKGIYVLVAGAPCVAYSICGERRGLSAKVGLHYTDQIDTYTGARIPVVILEQVPGAAEIQPNDKVTQESGQTAQEIVEQKFKDAGYEVSHKTFNAADYGGAVNRERMITVAIRGDLSKKKQFTWPTATVRHDRHKLESETTVRHMLDHIPQKRYLLPQRRMYEFEENTNSGSSRARKLYQRSKEYESQAGIGSPYDPNTVYSLDGPAPSPTARGNSRYFEWIDSEDRQHFRRLNPREMARCMGVPLGLIKGLNDVDAYRLVGNSVSDVMSEVIGPIARSLIDTEILQERLAKYKMSTPVADKSKKDNSQDISKNGIVADCLHQQMWNRITQNSELTDHMVEDAHSNHMMPTHPDNKLNEEGQVQIVTGCIHHKTEQMTYRNQESMEETRTEQKRITAVNLMQSLEQYETNVSKNNHLLNLNEEGKDIKHQQSLGQAEPDQGLNEEGQEDQFINTIEGCEVDLNEEGNMATLQEPHTDEDLNISDCLDGGINHVSDTARINAITATMNRCLFETVTGVSVEGDCNRIRLDVDRQKNITDVWDTIKKGQKMDDEIKVVRDYLVMGKSIPLAMNSLQADARKCHVYNDIVYRMQEDNQTGPMLRLWVPANMQEELTSRTHLCPLTCHPREPSLKRTLERRYFWPTMADSCKQVVDRCDICEKTKRPPGKAGDKREVVPISKPMSVVAMDVVGPMGNAKSATSNKNRFIVSFIDWFSRFCICYAVTNTDAETIGDCITKFTQRLGTPVTLISDNASYFTDAALSQYERRMGIKHSFVSAFRPEGNGLLERFHSNLGRSMKVRAAASRSINWDQELDSIMFAYNIAEHSVTGYSPFYLIHGWYPTLPFDITAPATDSEYGSYSKWVAAAASRLRIAHDHAYRRMTAAQIDRVKKNHSKKEPLKAGDKVYLWVPSIPRGAIKKLALRWHGPYEVIDRYHGTRKFTIRTQRGNRVVHEHRIRKSWTDENFEVNKAEDDEFEDLLDDSGRVDGIFDNKHSWAQVMTELLATDPYETAGDTDDNVAGDVATKFDLAFIVSKHDDWCQTTEAARAKSREPEIDHSADYNNTTQEDQIQQAAEDLVNQQSFLQLSAECQKCEGIRARVEHHSICCQCWYQISMKDNRSEQAADEITKISGHKIVGTDLPQTAEIRMEPNHWYRFAKTFDTPHKNEDESVKKCATCNITNVIVSHRELRTHCANKGECTKFDTREKAFVMKSAELHVSRDINGNYDWIPSLDKTAEDLIDEDEDIEMKSVERNSARQVEDYSVLSICGIEPKGSQYRVKWANYANKPRGEVMKLASVLGSSQLIIDYFMSAAGVTRMNTIKKMFQATAPIRVQNTKLISSFAYKAWCAQITSDSLPHKYIHRVALLQLQQSGCPTQESLVAHLKNKSTFPDKARFTAWIIPYGFRNSKLGSVVIPVHSLSTGQVSLLFKIKDRDTMSAYGDKVRTSLDKHQCISHWVLTAAADERDDIIRNSDDETYAIGSGFYKG